MVTSWKDLTAEQYLQLSKQKKNQDILSIVFGQDINEIPVSKWKDVDLSWLNKDPEKTDVRFYVHEGKTYGLLDFSQMSMGEYVDVTSFAENWEANIFKILAVFYRPLKKGNWKHRFKVWIGTKLAVGGSYIKNQKVVNLGLRLMLNSDYQITKYEGDKDLAREDIYRSMPADQFHSFILFFSTLLMQRTLSTLNFSDLKIPQRKTSPKKPKQNSPSKAGDGTTSSTQSRTRKSGGKTKSSNSRPTKS